MNIFVVIVTYNGKQWYDHSLGSLWQSLDPVKVVAVDNASTDGSAEYIRQQFPEVILLEQKENLGFGKANNIGIKYALDHEADFVFLLNQDAWIEPDTISELVAISQTHPEYGILSPVHLNAEKNNIEHLLLLRLDDFRTTDSALFDDLFFDRLKDVYDTKYVNAAAWLLPRKTIETVGGFDPFFFIYGEDDNYLNRVQYHGMKIGVCPKIRMVHDNNRTRPLYDSREHEVLMMIDYTDVNKSHSIKRDLWEYWFKAVKSFLKGRRKVAKQHFADYQWLKKHRLEIETSVAVNREKGKQWL
ncbi:MAG: glycosyltransferase family 2 protein [Bacteroidales bacterium]|nr:glycosyltransferase family 2 protein [Bacteroidales bacterium]